MIFDCSLLSWLIIRMQLDINGVVDMVFSSSPLPPCTYKIELIDDTLVFQVLYKILIKGARKLYGPDITADNINSNQLNTLKRYIQSLGYLLKYNYSFDDETLEPTHVNVWFETIKGLQNCNGFIVY